jgi:hypothetical protein
MNESCSCGKSKSENFKYCFTCNSKNSKNDKYAKNKNKTANKIESVSMKIHTSQLINVLFMYTDGSCIGNTNVANRVCPAGWGVVVAKPDLVLGNQFVDVLSLEKDDDFILVEELYGPLVLESSSQFYLHAKVGRFSQPHFLDCYSSMCHFVIHSFEQHK